MMTNQPNSKPAGSLLTKWELRTYDVWGNSKDGYEVNDVYPAGEIELRIPQTRYNVGVEWHVCRNAECPGNRGRTLHGVLPEIVYQYSDDAKGMMRHHAECPECKAEVKLESQEFVGAAPSDRQIKRAFGVTCRIETDGDDLYIEVTRQRDGYPIGEMRCVSHESLSPVRARS